MAYGDNPYQVLAVHEADESERASFLRRVGALTFGGLAVAGITSVASAAVVLVVPALMNQWVSLAVMLGAMFAARGVGSTLVHHESSGVRMAGFVAGTGLQGVAMGYLMLAAVAASIEVYANPLVFLVQAMGLVGLTVLGMVAYLMTGPRNLSMIGAGLSALSLPMLGLMVISFVWPVNGILGVLLSLVFVGVSAGGLLYNLNEVMHNMSTRMVVPAAYHVTLGILVLFWNLLTLLMRLQRR